MPKAVRSVIVIATQRGVELETDKLFDPESRVQGAKVRQRLSEQARRDQQQQGQTDLADDNSFTETRIPGSISQHPSSSPASHNQRTPVSLPRPRRPGSLLRRPRRPSSGSWSRRPFFRLLLPLPRTGFPDLDALEAFFDDPDDRHRVVGHVDRFSDYSFLSPEPGLPEIVGQHGDGVLAGQSIVIGLDRASECGAHPESLEIIARH